MKVIINENQRGYLFRNGTYVGFLKPGKHSHIALLGYRIEVVDIDYFVDNAGVDIRVLMADKDFEESVLHFVVPDNMLAVHYVDNRISNVFQHGEYCIWNLWNENRIELLDMTKTEMDKELAKQLIPHLPTSCYQKIEIADGETGLLYFDEQFQRLLVSSVYHFWKQPAKVSCQIVDTRAQQQEINGQEILTIDKVALRVNFVYTYRILDPLALLTSIKDYKQQLYVLTQLALREYIGKYRFDELLDQKDSIASIVLQKLQQSQQEFCTEFLSAGIKDIILPGEIRDIMNTVLIAEKTAQANVISRREEVASTRSLLNTAKLMDENQTLYRLKELEYLERICDRVGSISVSGGDNLLKQLNTLMAQPQSATNL